MSEDRRKPGIALWASILLVGVPLLYLVGFGPACWWSSPPRSGDGWMVMNLHDSEPHAPAAYWPIGWLIAYGPQPVSRALQWYALLRTDRVWLPTNPKRYHTMVMRD